MDILTNTTSLVLWHDVVKHAEDQCAVALKDELEHYLVSLLVRYSNKPQIVQKVIATAFLEALQLRERERHVSLQYVGDQCLIFAGLFPQMAKTRHVKVGYFVDLGRSAYLAISEHGNDLYQALALQFVVLMDVLQSIRHDADLLPLEAYDQWAELGSQRALKILNSYTRAVPFKHFK